jgi:uncharacterized protein YaaQ
MKLIIAVVQNRDTEITIKALNEAGFVVTRMASTGGFLREGNTTLFIGTDNECVDMAVDTLKKHCHSRTLVRPLPATGFESGVSLHHYAEVTVGGATVFILDVDHFEQV